MRHLPCRNNSTIKNYDHIKPTYRCNHVVTCNTELFFKNFDMWNSINSLEIVWIMKDIKEMLFTLVVATIFSILD